MEHTTVATDAEFAAVETAAPSRAVVEAVAEAEDVDPTDLAPLYGVVDPDALDALFTSPLSESNAPTTAGTVTFTYEGYRVEVTGGGRVSLEDAE